MGAYKDLMDGVWDGDPIVVSGSRELNIPKIPSGKRFELWISISNVTVKQTKTNRFTFNFEGNGNVDQQSEAVFLVEPEGMYYGGLEFTASNQPQSCRITFEGWYTVNSIELYQLDGEVKAATKESIGVVRPVSTGGIKVIEKDNTEKNEKAGDISINVGDGLNITEEGKLTTTSDLSGSNLTSVKFYTASGGQGMDVNGKYFFQKVDGGMQYLNGKRKIPVTKVTTSVVDAYNAYIASQTTTEEGDTNG